MKNFSVFQLFFFLICSIFECLLICSLFTENLILAIVSIIGFITSAIALMVTLILKPKGE